MSPFSERPGQLYCTALEKHSALREMGSLDNEPVEHTDTHYPLFATHRKESTVVKTRVQKFRVHRKRKKKSLIDLQTLGVEAQTYHRAHLLVLMQS